MNWLYDETRQVGVDFESAAQVAEYDSQQGSNREAEQALISQLGIEAPSNFDRWKDLGQEGWN